MKQRVRNMTGNSVNKGFNCQLRAFVTSCQAFSRTRKSEERPEIPNIPTLYSLRVPGPPGSGWFGCDPGHRPEVDITTAGTHHQASSGVIPIEVSTL